MMNSFFRMIVLWLTILLWCALLSICQAIHIDIVRKPSLKFNGLKVSNRYLFTKGRKLEFPARAKFEGRDSLELEFRIFCRGFHVVQLE